MGRRYCEEERVLHTCVKYCRRSILRSGVFPPWKSSQFRYSMSLGQAPDCSISLRRRRRMQENQESDIGIERAP